MYIISIILWVMVFLINMSLLTGTFSFLEAILAKPRTFGSINFSFGNILFFTVIVYLANKLQKHVPVLFGEGSLTYDGEVEHKSSKVALIRLVIIVIGVLFAVTASGLPMDRLTVILGALGVGIGLGMQNIVNNFVSGIILIFERPFRIGDYVELADKKGKVKDIGIRSSKLLTPQGSEVIIPNGDLLSGRLVNWTLSHDYVKSELIFKVDSEANLDALTKMIEEEVKQTTHVMEELPIEVLLNGFAAGSIEIKVMVWVQSIYVEPVFKSEILVRLMKRLKEMKINIV
jgi:potassium efflux system protein